MNDLETYSRRYLDRWYARASVRQETHYRAEPGFDLEAMVNPRYVEFLDCPEVVALGRDARHNLMMQFCYGFLEEVARGESEVVNRICIELSGQEGRHLLPHLGQQALMTVAIDETFHAFLARDAILSLESLTGIAMCRPLGPGLLATIFDEVLGACPEDLRPFVKLLAVSLIENGVTDELVELTRAGERASPFYEFNREHLIDEARHRTFFRVALVEAFRRLGPAERACVAEILPRYLDSYFDQLLRGDADQARQRLLGIGLSDVAVQALLDRDRSAPGERRQHPTWANMRRCLAATGLLDDAAISQKLLETGWLAEDRPLDAAA
ncbi:MAG: hypothetical protein Kilf2KO_13560 [Rhodospirillales bacterium]